MPDKAATVKLKLDKSQFVTNVAKLEREINATWDRVADHSSVIGKRVRQWAADAGKALKSAFSTDEIGRGPFMKMLASLDALKTASFAALRKNALSLKSMLTADEIGRTPFMRLRDAAQKFKKDSISSLKANAKSVKEYLRPDAMIAAVKKGSAATKAFMSPDEVGRGPFMKMLDGLKKLEGSSLAAFRRMGAASKTAFGKTKDWWGAHSESMSSGGGFMGRMKSRVGGMFRGSAGDEPGQRGALTSGGIAGAMMVKDLVMGGVSSAIAKGMDLLSSAGATSESAAQLSVNARGQGQAYIDPKVLEAEAYAVTQQVKGTTADDAIAAMSQFTSLTGDLKTARASIGTFATVARSTGASLADVAASTAAISQQFKITDPEQIKEVLASLTYQGKAGAIELSDLATGLQTLAASGASFGLSGVKGVKTLGGITQIAKQGSGSAAETFTAVQGIFRELAAKTTVLEKQKVQVYEGKGSNKKTRDPTEIIIDAISKIGGNDVAKKATGLQSIFNDSLKGLKPLLSIYNDTVRNTVGTDKEKTAAGVNALRKALDGAINAAGDWSDVVGDSAKMQNTNSAKMAAAMEKFKGQIGETVLPEVTKFIDALAKSPTAIAGFSTAIIATGETLSAFNKLFSIGQEDTSTVSSTDWEKSQEKQRKDKETEALHDRGLFTSDEQKDLRDMGLIDKNGFSTAQPSNGLQSVPSSADPIAAMDAQSKLEAGLGSMFRMGNTGAGKSAFTEWAAQTPIQAQSQMQKKQAEQMARQAETERAQAASSTQQSGQAASAFIPMQLRGMGGSSTPAPAARPGPVTIGNVVDVRITADSTTRGSIPSPTPGNVARL